MPMSVSGAGTPSSVIKGVDKLVKNQWMGAVALILSVIALFVALLK